MTAIANAAALCRELNAKRIPYQLLIVRDEALMVSVAVPGERWEMEFFEDGHIELEKFSSEGVDDAPSAPSELLSLLDS